MEDIWLSDAMKYESEVRVKSVRELCNKKDVEQLRYTLRIALEKLQAAQPRVQLTDGGLAKILVSRTWHDKRKSFVCRIG